MILFTVLGITIGLVLSLFFRFPLYDYSSQLDIFGTFSVFLFSLLELTDSLHDGKDCLGNIGQQVWTRFIWIPIKD